MSKNIDVDIVAKESTPFVAELLLGSIMVQTKQNEWYMFCVTENRILYNLKTTVYVTMEEYVKQFAAQTGSYKSSVNETFEAATIKARQVFGKKFKG